MTAALYLVGAFGLAYIVGHSVISLPLRSWLGGHPGGAEVDGGFGKVTPPKPGALGQFGELLCTLLECPSCFGFWTGLVAALLYPEQVRGFLPFSPVWFTLALVTTGSNFILARLTRLA